MVEPTQWGAGGGLVVVPDPLNQSAKDSGNRLPSSQGQELQDRQKNKTKQKEPHGAGLALSCFLTYRGMKVSMSINSGVSGSGGGRDSEAAE